MDETLVARSTLEVTVTLDSTSIPTPESPMVTLEIRQLMIQLALVFFRGASVPHSSSESMSATIMETGSTSYPARLTPAADILEGLITQVIDQFLSVMEHCTKLVLLGGAPSNSCGHCSRTRLKYQEDWGFRVSQSVQDTSRSTGILFGGLAKH